MMNRCAPLLALLILLPAASPAAQFTVNVLTDSGDASAGDGLCADLDDNCSLRAAGQEANALPGGDQIVLAAGVHRLTLDGEEEDGALSWDLDNVDDLEISGAGAAQTLIGQDAAGHRVIEAFNSPQAKVAVTLRDLTNFQRWSRSPHRVKPRPVLTTDADSVCGQ